MIRFALPVELCVGNMYDTMMVGAQDHDVGVIIIEAACKIVDVMGVDKMDAIRPADVLPAYLAAVAIDAFKIFPNGP